MFLTSQKKYRTEILCIYGVILLLNISAWGSALVVFAQHPLLMGTALLSFGLGLRHAVDADHIAAIDNVTRKLIQTGQKPVATGFFFALGHSSVVILACLLIAWSSTEISTRFDNMKEIGGLIGTLVSASFLFIIAAINALLLRATYRSWQVLKKTGIYSEENMSMPGTGLIARSLGPMFRLIRRSWQMYPLGFLFGLGFDTATEIALLGIAATQSSSGLSVWAIMIFPLLFCAGMTLVDTLNGHLMIRAYGWAQVQPQRKLFYNMTITFISVIVVRLRWCNSCQTSFTCKVCSCV
jgi:nickel/cobalt transporter (NiCoT) family protein